MSKRNKKWRNDPVSKQILKEIKASVRKLLFSSMAIHPFRYFENAESSLARCQEIANANKPGSWELQRVCETCVFFFHLVSSIGIINTRFGRTRYRVVYRTTLE
ncbi:hypothetical protein CEXT_575311 [Caerostris extrusa]|uniref:Uncharacterized protein n=1 Tax=Caerostris extrusa TaxID=172846 RepID=A0AAV4W6H5_CAEEX|nr:hypothetical protein CEXT_575311 [Caerostris extrusa]